MASHEQLNDQPAAAPVEPSNTAIPRILSKTKAEMERAKALKDAGKEAPKDSKISEIVFTEHYETITKICQDLDTDRHTGLTTARAAALQEEYGPNALTPPAGKHWFVLFMEHMTGFFSLLLWGASILCFIAFGLDSSTQDNLYLGVVLSIVVFLTGCFSYFQDAKSAAMMAGFAKLTPEKTFCIRDGKERELEAVELVPGDLVVIKNGSKIPADVRIIKCDDMKVDNASLTGEAEPQKRTADIEKEGSLPLEAKNLAFYGTNCVNGQATGIVVKTADNTVIGTIAGMVATQGTQETPIAIEIHHFIKIISVVAIILGVSFFIIGVSLGYDILDNVIFAIGIIVANVPEGLLATVTVSLTLTAQRMKIKCVLVKNLESVETLGSTICIASDKTGTLTQNIMTAQHVWYDGTIKLAQGLGDSVADQKNPSMRKLRECMVLCSTATFVDDEKNPHIPGTTHQNRPVNGDASEAALIKYMENILEVEKSGIVNERKKNPTVFKLPFNSANKFMIHIRNMEGDFKKDRVIFMKGAPERVLKRCSTILINGKEEKLELHRHSIAEGMGTLMNNGERVLGFCFTTLPADKYGENYEYKWDGEGGADSNFPTQDYTFIGLVALIDPPRDAVPGAVLSCQSAGIQVIMVTGDHPDTAEAIAKMVNIVKHPTKRDIARKEGVSMNEVPDDHPEIGAIVIKGSDLLLMDDEQLNRVLDYDEIVFARTSPSQKLRIVNGLQEKQWKRFKDGRPAKRVKHVVAVTGDGVNDSPALKKADIGVAMGIVGTAVAKDAADMILLNDDFASIVNGVEEGRKIFDNLKKSIAYTLSSNIPEITPFLIFILVQIPLPLTTVLILLIDLGTDMIPAISLAYEEKEADIMMKPPRDSRVDRLVTRKLVSFSYLQIGVIQALAGFYTYFVVLHDYGFAANILPGLSNLFIDFADDTGSVTFFDSNNVQLDSGGSLVSATRMVYEGDSFDLQSCNIEDADVCHKPDEALAFAQSAFFVSIVVVQWADLIACKTRKLSLYHQGMRNMMMNFGLFSETILAIFLSYIPAINVPLGTRPIRFVHWMTAMPFSMIILIYDEVRKYLIRTLPKGSKGEPNIVEEYTYY